MIFEKIVRMARLIVKPENVSDVPLKGVVFDMDGTLCKPQTWMFAKMREALGITKAVDILDHVHSLPDEEQQKAQKALEDIEREAMVQIIPQPGLLELMDFLDEVKIPKAICTRNFPIPVYHLLSEFLPEHKFEPIITREFHPPKPHPAGILKIADSWNANPEHVIMVGDSIDDMKAGANAGATTILLESPDNKNAHHLKETDYIVQSLSDIIALLKNGIKIKRVFVEGEPTKSNGTS